MKIIKPNAELLTHDIPAYQFIEKVGRTCYKSEDKIIDTSAVNFVKALVKNKHLAMLEHEYLYFNIIGGQAVMEDLLLITSGDQDTDNMKITKYLNVFGSCISGSFRAWIEYFKNASEIPFFNSPILFAIYRQLHDTYPDIFNNDRYIGFGPMSYSDALKYARLVPRKEIESSYKMYSEPSNLLPHTIKFTCDRGVSHEFVRHRPASFAQESTRYCNYSHNKFGNELTFIEPCFWDYKVDDDGDLWHYICEESEKIYFTMLKDGATPEQARSILPNSLKTELIITATEEEWQHIVDLRYHGTTGKPHPQMKEVMDIAYPLLVQSSEGRIK